MLLTDGRLSFTAFSLAVPFDLAHAMPNVNPLVINRIHVRLLLRLGNCNVLVRIFYKRASRHVSIRLPFVPVLIAVLVRIVRIVVLVLSRVPHHVLVVLVLLLLRPRVDVNVLVFVKLLGGILHKPLQ